MRDNNLLDLDASARHYSLNHLVTIETMTLIDKILTSFASAVENDGEEKAHDERLRAIKRIAYIVYAEGNA